MLLNNADWRAVFADGGISADSFADELVLSLGPQYFKVEGLFKFPWGIGVEPDLQNHLTFGWYNPAKCCQAACEYIHTHS